MITDVVLTVAIVSFIWCLSFISFVFLVFSEEDNEIKKGCAVVVLGAILFVLTGYCGYMLLGV